jgi:hypothetical protein
MFKYQGMVSATLILGGVDVIEPHLHVISINHAPTFIFSLHSEW